MFSGARWAIFLIGFCGTLGAQVPREPPATARSQPLLEIMAVDAAGNRLDLRTAHASISRGLPGDLAVLTHHPDEAIDAQSSRFVICGPNGSLPTTVGIQTTRRSGERLDTLPEVPLLSGPAPLNTGSSLRCVHTPLLRVTADAQDADYPGLRARSLEGELGGTLQVTSKMMVLASLPVGGPRELSAGASLMQAKLRVRMVRTFPGGVPPFGRDDVEAVSMLYQEIHGANQLWGQCGIFFDDERNVDIAIVDPPEPYLMSIGCGFGVAASGGQIGVLVGGKLLTLDIKPGEVPRTVALRLAQRAEHLGFRVEVYRNPRVLSSALPSFDVGFKKPNGQWAHLEPVPGRPLSSDTTLGVCVGVVDLSDGLEHFTNGNAMTGTLEERSLLRAVIDQDPATIDVVVVESFSRSGRIGESFVSSEDGALGNIVVLNRAGFRVGARSYALAHELGHILLDLPGHPDDYGVDTPWNLMDSDAVDGTIFGPKHLTLDDCRRAIAQSGPTAPAALLQPW
jgi:hypothetical protein